MKNIDNIAQSFKCNFENPYTCENNIIIWLYNYFRPYNARSKLSKILFYGISLIVRRILFSLIKFKSIGYTFGTIDGKKFPLRSLNSQFHSIYFKEYSKCYEPEVFAAIELFLPKNGVFVDVGSNWGHHTFMAMSRKNARVIAFEPNDSVYSDLEKISNALGYKGQLTAYNLGIGSEESRFELVQSRFESGLASMSEEFNDLVKNSYKLWPEKLLDRITFKTDYVQLAHVISLDSCITESVSCVDLIKLDCEGVELEALQGSVETLKRYAPAVIFELHPEQSSIRLEKFREFFLPLGYKLYEVRVDVPASECFLKPLDLRRVETWCNVIAVK